MEVNNEAENDEAQLAYNEEYTDVGQAIPCIYKLIQSKFGGDINA